MTQDLESVMKAALDEKFFSFTHSDAGGTQVVEWAVTKNYRHDYKTISQTESGSRGGMARANQNLKRRAIFWTPEKIEQLTKLRAQNHGARVMGRMLGTSRTMKEQRVKLFVDAITLRGIKTAREIGAMHGVSRMVVIGLWWRAKLPKVPMKTRGRLVSRGHKLTGFKPAQVHTRSRPFRLSSMPSQAKLAATPRSEPDWWSEKYLHGNLMVRE